MMNDNVQQQPLDLNRVVVAHDVLKLINAATARRYGILPISLEGDEELRVVLADRDDDIGVSQVEAGTGMIVQVAECVNSTDTIRRAIDRYYPRITENAGSPLELLEEVINRALQMHCSDIHFDPKGEYAVINMRVDGVMREDRQVSLSEHSELVSAIKVASHMDISEHRIPQDGQMALSSLGEEISMRIATIPTIHGEKITLRILATAAVSEELTDINSLGMSETHKKIFLDSLNHSNGIILLSGPTGSGKTTTLYAALRHLAAPGTHHILSIEDPVEIPFPGINQVYIDSERVSFQKALRSTLRHDPDIIMIGEIRDSETADIAVKSALTGHLVLSTLHANDSIGVIARLLNLGVSNDLVVASLRLVIAQRLVRTPCRHCMSHVAPSADEIELFHLDADADHIVPEVHGCSLCGYTGYAGRLGLYEMIPVEKKLRDMIQNKLSHDELADFLFKQRHLPTIFSDGLEKALAQQTTLSEVKRVAYLGEGS